MIRTRSLTLNLFKVTLCCSHKSAQSDHIAGGPLTQPLLAITVRAASSDRAQTLPSPSQPCSRGASGNGSRCAPRSPSIWPRRGGDCCRHTADLPELDRLENRADGRLDPCVARHCGHLQCISTVCDWSPWFCDTHLLLLLALSPFDASDFRRNHHPLPMRPSSPPLPPLAPPSTTRPFSIERGDPQERRGCGMSEPARPASPAALARSLAL